MDITRSDTNLDNLIAMALDTIMRSMRYNEPDNAKIILRHIYDEGYRDGKIDSIIELTKKDN